MQCNGKGEREPAASLPPSLFFFLSCSRRAYSHHRRSLHPSSIFCTSSTHHTHTQGFFPPFPFLFLITSVGLYIASSLHHPLAPPLSSLTHIHVHLYPPFEQPPKSFPSLLCCTFPLSPLPFAASSQLPHLIGARLPLGRHDDGPLLHPRRENDAPLDIGPQGAQGGGGQPRRLFLLLLCCCC